MSFVIKLDKIEMAYLMDIQKHTWLTTDYSALIVSTLLAMVYVPCASLHLSYPQEGQGGRFHHGAFRALMCGADLQGSPDTVRAKYLAFCNNTIFFYMQESIYVMT